MDELGTTPSYSKETLNGKILRYFWRFIVYVFVYTGMCPHVKVNIDPRDGLQAFSSGFFLYLLSHLFDLRTFFVVLLLQKELLFRGLSWCHLLFLQDSETNLPPPVPALFDLWLLMQTGEEMTASSKFSQLAGVNKVTVCGFYSLSWGDMGTRN